MPVSCILLKWSLGLKPSTGAPMRVESLSMKSVCRCLMPECPAIRLSKNSTGFLPTGEMMPSPVMTTRLVIWNLLRGAFLRGDDLVDEVGYVANGLELGSLVGQPD